MSPRHTCNQIHLFTSRGQFAAVLGDQYLLLSTQAYSYTLYDPLGRITEVGEKATADRIESTCRSSEFRRHQS